MSIAFPSPLVWPSPLLWPGSLVPFVPVGYVDSDFVLTGGPTGSKFYVGSPTGSPFAVERIRMLFLGGVEYAKWTVQFASAGAVLQVEFNGDGQWYPLAVDGDDVSFLVTHPEHGEGPPVGSVVLKMGKNTVQMRDVGSPEVLYRDAGNIYVLGIGA